MRIDDRVRGVRHWYSLSSPIYLQAHNATKEAEASELKELLEEAGTEFLEKEEEL